MDSYESILLNIDHYIGASVIGSSFKCGSVTSVHVNVVMLDIMEGGSYAFLILEAYNS